MVSLSLKGDIKAGGGHSTRMRNVEATSVHHTCQVGAAHVLSSQPALLDLVPTKPFWHWFYDLYLKKLKHREVKALTPVPQP